MVPIYFEYLAQNNYFCQAFFVQQILTNKVYEPGRNLKQKKIVYISGFCNCL
jgi:hypothetical protein